MPLCRERCYLEDRNIRLATVLYCLAMVLNTSSSLTNAIASIGLSLDTYLNNMLANWAPLGYLIGAVTIIVLRSKGVVIQDGKKIIK